MKKHIALFGATMLFGSLLGGTGVLAEEAQNNNTPNPASAQTTVQGNLELSDQGGYNPNPPSSDLNDKTGISTSYFGIAYKPTKFDIGKNINLADTNDEQHIVMQSQTDSPEKKAFHVGVKDKTRSDNRAWKLTAKLDQEIEEGLGISIKAKTKNDSVKRNINDGVAQFEDHHLIDQVKKDGSTNEVTNSENLEITKTDAEVMKATQGKFVNAVYDLELPQVELYIPDASKVKAQELNTNVTWTLTDAAQ